MALLMSQVDPDTIRLVGRWRSDTVLRYLHMTTKTFTEVVAIKKFEHDTYAPIPPEHAVNWCQAALKGPEGPYSKGFLGYWYRISVVLANKYRLSSPL